MGILFADTQKSKQWWGDNEVKAAKFQNDMPEFRGISLKPYDVERYEPLLRESAKMKSFHWLKI